MDFELPEELQMLRSTVREFADRELAPVAGDLDAAEEFPENEVKKAAELGLLSVAVPDEYGGMGVSASSQAGSLVVEELSRVCPSTAVTVSVHNSLVCAPISRHGSELVKRKYLPRLASGEILGAYALSEADAGTDAANLRTAAEKKGDKYILNGAKLWITSGTHADLFVVFARTSPPEGNKRSRGVTAFLVEKNFGGLSVGKKEEKLGIRASSTTEILLDQCEVPADNVLGEIDRGFRVAMDTLDGGRIGIASQALGITQGCLDASIAYAKDRRQFGRPIGDFQAIQWKIAEMATQLEAARLLTRKAAATRDAGERCTREAAMAKLFASQLSNRAADDAVQIHGSAGYSREYVVERLFRDARITEIYEGTTEVQRLVVARSLLN
jgi:butyryl-CoA dehydrogenase